MTIGSNTIGGFISVLRKENGMTQKQLAEQLDVSDKSVSRWEWDETALDFSLIPIIAEIFSVTMMNFCEEKGILQTKKNDVQQAERQIKAILNRIMARYKSL